MTEHEKRIREELEIADAEDRLFADVRTKDIHSLITDLDNERRENNLRKEIIASGNQLVKKLEDDLDRLRDNLDAMRGALKSVQAAIYMDDAGQLSLTRSFDESTIDSALKGASA